MNTETIRDFRKILRQLEREIGWQLKDETECCGVTVSQCHLILEIGNVGECSLIDLANTLRLDSSTLSRNIHNMVEAGLIQRNTNPDDRRYVTLTLTSAGHTIYTSIELHCNQDYQQILGFIPEDKHQQIIESFTLFTRALTQFREGGHSCCSDTTCSER